MAANARENILNRIKEALVNPVPLPFPNNEEGKDIFVENTEDLSILFAKEFTSVSGNFSFCENKKALKIQLQQLITEKGWTKIFYKESLFENQLIELGIEEYKNLSLCEVSITDCESLVARTGTMVLGTGQASGRTTDRKSTRLNSSHRNTSRMPSSA